MDSFRWRVRIQYLNPYPPTRIWRGSLNIYSGLEKVTPQESKEFWISIRENFRKGSVYTWLRNQRGWILKGSFKTQQILYLHRKKQKKTHQTASPVASSDWVTFFRSFFQKRWMFGWLFWRRRAACDFGDSKFECLANGLRHSSFLWFMFGL